MKRGSQSAGFFLLSMPVQTSPDMSRCICLLLVFALALAAGQLANGQLAQAAAPRALGSFGRLGQLDAFADEIDELVLYSLGWDASVRIWLADLARIEAAVAARANATCASLCG